MTSGGGARSAAPGWLTANTYAHRGAHEPGIPENSLAAAEAAIARGYGIECDVQRSRDDCPMVFHDWNLSRLTGVESNVEELLADELGKLSLLGTDQRPLLLERLLDGVNGRVPILIEIKSQPGHDPERTCIGVSNLLHQYRGPAAVMSFDRRVPEWFGAHSPETVRGLVGTDSYPNGFETMWRLPDCIAAAGHSHFLALDRRDLNRPEAAEWRAEGRPLLSWTIRTRIERAAASRLADALIAEGEALA